MKTSLISDRCPTKSHKASKRIAYACLVLPDGEEKRREIIEFDEDGNPLAHHPLTQEEPFTEWRDETYTIRRSK